MNIRKPTDYSILFSKLGELMTAQSPPMELYCEIGRLVSGRAGKGAAVVASEYLQTTYPAAEFFLPATCAVCARFTRPMRKSYG